jgi:hypothetical protein
VQLNHTKETMIKIEPARAPNRMGLKNLFMKPSPH